MEAIKHIYIVEIEDQFLITKYALDLEVVLKMWTDFSNKMFSDWRAEPSGYLLTKHDQVRFDSLDRYDFPALIRKSLETGSVFKVNFRDHMDYKGSVMITRELIAT